MFRTVSRGRGVPELCPHLALVSGDLHTSGGEQRHKLLLLLSKQLLPRTSPKR